MANKANLANSVLFAPLSDVDTELEVYTGDGTLFPAAPFFLTISPKNKWSRVINSEIVLVTDVTGDVLTITRAQKGTTAREFSYGDLVANGIYVEDLDDTVDIAVAAALESMMPVGFVVTLGVSTNPATLYGFGTWTAITGKVVVGISGSDTEFDTLNETGGTKTHTLTTAEMPAHTHSNRWRAYMPNGTGSLALNDLTGDAILITDAAVAGTNISGDPTVGNSAGSGNAHNNLQPYIVKYVWERTA